jgi:predicted transcriptional regulator
MKNIRDDLSKLKELGLIEMVKEKENKRKPLIPVTKYDKLQVSIEI